MNNKAKLKIQFDALMITVTGMSEEIKDGTEGDGFCRAIYRADGYEYLLGLTQLSAPKTIQQITEEKQADEEARLTAAGPGPEQQSMVFAPKVEESSLDHLQEAIDREANPVPTMEQDRQRLGLTVEEYYETLRIQEVEGGDIDVIAKRFDRNDDKHVAQNGSD